MTDARVSQEVLQVLHGGETSDANVSQEVLQVLHGGITSDARVSQEVLQVLYQYIKKVSFNDADATNLYNEYGDVTESNLKFAIVNSQDVSAITSILAQGNDGALVNGEGVFKTSSPSGNYIVVIKGTDDKIGAFITEVVETL